jgi:uncharacterized protein YegL
LFVLRCKTWLAVVLLVTLIASPSAYAQETDGSGFGQSLRRALDPNSQSGQLIRGVFKNLVGPRVPSGYSAPSGYGNYSPSSPSISPPSGFSGSSGNPTTSVTIPNLNSRELSSIGMYDVALLVDKSGSMAELDCPSGIFDTLGNLFFRKAMGATTSRWHWSQQQITYLSQQASTVLQNGITLVLFDSGHKVFNRVNANDIVQIFASNQPGGGTNMSAALNSQLKAYFKRRDSSYGQVKPLSITILSDGVPSNAGAVRSAIIDATKKMTNPGEIAITMLQLGADRKGANFLQELDYGMVNEGAAFDIVTSKPFTELVAKGLPRAIVESISTSSSTMR